MRNCSRLFLFPILSISLYGQTSNPNQLTPEEKASGWTLLFDGKSFRNWMDPLKLKPEGKSWAIENGTIKALASPAIQEDLLSARAYKDFELLFEWKISPGGNSGVKYRIHEALYIDEGKAAPRTKFEDIVGFELEHRSSKRTDPAPEGRKSVYSIGFEFQLIDNDKHKDAQRGPKYQSGALYGMIPPAQAAAKAPGEWNQARIVVRGDSVEHWLNGVKVLEGNLKGQEVKEALESRWKPAPKLQEMLLRSDRQRWPVALQNHGDEAWFRSIKIRELNGQAR